MKQKVRKRMKREEMKQKIVKAINFVIILSVFLVLLIVAVKMMILQFFPKCNTCEYVCAHLFKLEKMGWGVYRLKLYPPFDIVYEKYASSGLDLYNPKWYPHPVDEEGIPTECYCGFNIKTLEEETYGHSIFVKKEIVVTVNYTYWKRWYYG